MGATFDTALDAVGSPRGIVHVDCGAMVLKSLQVGAGLVWNGMDVISKVGRTSHLVDKALPGGGSTKVSRQVRD